MKSPQGKTLYRGTLGHPIAFPESTIITAANLGSIDFDRIVYYENSPMGAMGNEGGILIYVLENEDSLVTYETNVSLDKQIYEAVLKLLDEKINHFIGLYGGMGNYVYLKNNSDFEIDRKYGCLWLHSSKTKLRIDSSVAGVFNAIVLEMDSKMARYSAGEKQK